MDMLRHRRHRARHLSVAKWCSSKKQWIRESYQLHWCETFHISTILTASCFGIPMPMHCTILCEWWQAPSSRQRIRCGEVQIKLNRCKSIVIVQMTAPLHALKSLKNSLHNAFAMQELLECVRRPTPSDNMDMLRHRRHRARHLSVAKWCSSKKQWIRESYSSIGVRLFTFPLFSQQVVLAFQCQCIVRDCANDGRRPPQDNGFDVARSRLNWTDVNLKW